MDLARLLRRHSPERHIIQLTRRDRASSPDLGTLDFDPGRPKLLLDTNVYIKQARGEIADADLDRLGRCELYHCSVSLSEFATGLANADVTAPQWRRQSAYYKRFFKAVPDHRIRCPDSQVWVEAGLLAGTLARIQRYQRSQMKEALNDALIFLTAKKAGFQVLTDNFADFDLLQQLVPSATCVYL